MVSKEELVKRFILDKSYRKRSTKRIALKFCVSENFVKECRKSANNSLQKNNTALKNNSISVEEDCIIKEVDNIQGLLKIVITSNFEPKSADDLAIEHNVDLSKYIITNYWTKKLPNNKFTSSLFCKLIKIEENIEAQKRILIKEIKSHSYMFAKWPLIKPTNQKNLKLLEISIPDIHFGKLADKDETGEDYNLQIATDRFKNAILYFLENCDTNNIDQIIFPIGNDLINVDNLTSSTTLGTRQDCDTRFHKIIKVVKVLLVDTILQLACYAKVHIPIIPGNHDMQSTFMIGEMLECYFHNHPNIVIDNISSLRKYYQFHNNAFMYTHGNNENHSSLSSIFASEQPLLWANASHRFCKLGHLHKYKKTEYITSDYVKGVQIEILPSLSGTDSWHSSKGYLNKKQAKATLYDSLLGEQVMYTYTLKDYSNVVL